MRDGTLIKPCVHDFFSIFVVFSLQLPSNGHENINKASKIESDSPDWLNHLARKEKGSSGTENNQQERQTMNSTHTVRRLIKVCLVYNLTFFSYSPLGTKGTVHSMLRLLLGEVNTALLHASRFWLAFPAQSKFFSPTAICNNPCRDLMVSPCWHNNCCRKDQCPQFGSLLRGYREHGINDIQIDISPKFLYGYLFFYPNTRIQGGKKVLPRAYRFRQVCLRTIVWLEPHSRGGELNQGLPCVQSHFFLLQPSAVVWQKETKICVCFCLAK